MSAVLGPGEYVNRLAAVAAIKDGWDDDGTAPAPKAEDIETARIMCEHLATCSVVPYIFPMLEVGVQLEWASAATHVIVEIQDGSPELRVLGGWTRETMAEVGELLRHIYIAMVLVREARKAVLS